jgi:hypothetical protein
MRYVANEQEIAMFSSRIVTIPLCLPGSKADFMHKRETECE